MYEDVFSNGIGKTVYQTFLKTIENDGLANKIQSGILLAFSGGMDSVVLLLLLLEYRKAHGNFPITAMHVHHGIRGEEADRDAAFCRDFCQSVHVPFLVEYANVPLYAKEHKCGLEEAAREERYRLLRLSLKSAGLSYIVTAHHLNDQAETVFFRILRGTGTRGLSGMTTNSEDVLRPLLFVSKEDISSFVQKFQISFVFDSTNEELQYKRNYIRHEIFPKLKKITEHPEKSLARLALNAGRDSDFVEQAAKSFWKNVNPQAVSVKDLTDLHEAVFYRVICYMTNSVTDVKPEEVHICAIRKALREKRAFCLSIPGACFVSNGIFAACRPAVFPFLCIEKQFLQFGQNIVSSSSEICLSHTKKEICSTIVYKNAIQADISSAIIDGELYVRQRLPKDTLRYGGVSHRIKTLFNQNHLSEERRMALPFVCDEKGVVWIPGFPPRDDGGKTSGNSLFVSFYYNEDFPAF